MVGNRRAIRRTGQIGNRESGPSEWRSYRCPSRRRPEWSRTPPTTCSRSVSSHQTPTEQQRAGNHPANPVIEPGRHRPFAARRQRADRLARASSPSRPSRPRPARRASACPSRTSGPTGRRSVVDHRRDRRRRTRRPRRATRPCVAASRVLSVSAGDEHLERREPRQIAGAKQSDEEQQAEQPAGGNRREHFRQRREDQTRAAVRLEPEREHGGEDREPREQPRERVAERRPPRVRREAVACR